MASTLLALLLTAFTGDSSCIVLHFTTSWCQPCRQMQPAIDQLKSSGWDIRSVDTDQHRPIAQQFKVENLPTLVILSEGREVDRIVGMASHAQIEKRVMRAAARSILAQPAQAGISHVNQTRPLKNQFAGQPSPQPIVRGQSPGLSAIPRSMASTLASSSIAGSISAGRLGSGGVPQPRLTPALSLDQAIGRAAQATVRIRVDEGNTIAYGTGTIVDVRGDEALVLTCGHLFRDMQPETQLTVDLFAGTPHEMNVPSHLVDFSADEVVGDIGLVSMKIPVLIEPVEILPRDAQLQIDQAVFSFGCDHGANPTRRNTRISRINRYTGAANVEIIGAPAVGRSGGGLFDEQGRLIGVCNAANANEDEGIYAAAAVVYAQLEELGLPELFDNRPIQHAGNSAIASAANPASRAPQPGLLVGTPSNSVGAARAQPKLPRSEEQSQWPDDSMTLAGANAPATGRAAQVICIVRDARGNDRMVTINAPSAELLERIHMDSQQ